MNVAAMIKKLRGKEYTVTRTAAGAYSTTTGVFVPGATSTFSLLGSVQPLGAKDIMTIPEGDRTRERKRFYAAPSLATIDVGGLKRADLVSVEGVSFMVESVETWLDVYSKAILVKVNTDAN